MRNGVNLDWNGNGWKSRARFVQSAVWDDEAWSSADTELDYDIETYGPQFMVSGTYLDDAGSYNKIGESEMLAARGSALAQVTTEDYSLSAMDWVEGSDMGANIYKLGDFDALFNGANFNNELDDLEVETEYDSQHSDEWRYQQLEVTWTSTATRLIGLLPTFFQLIGGLAEGDARDQNF